MALCGFRISPSETNATWDCTRGIASGRPFSFQTGTKEQRSRNRRHSHRRLRHTHIRVNAVCPGWVATDMGASAHLDVLVFASLLLNSAAIALLGPGAHSVDPRLFGRQFLQRRTRPSESISLEIHENTLERGCAGFGNGVVLIAGTAAHTDCAHNFATTLQRDSPGEDHDLAIIGGMDAEELSTRLGVGGEILGGNVKSP